MSAVPSALACFHCGLPTDAVGAWSVEIGGTRKSMCCPGCAAVAQGIVNSGCADYYRTRTAYADQADTDAALPAELALVDDAATGELTLSVEGMRCAACAWLIEHRLARVAGVRAASVNVTTSRLRVSYDSALCQPSAVVAALRAIGYASWPYTPARHGQQLERERKTLFRQLFLAGLSMMQVMMYALPAYVAGEGAMEADMAALMRWAALALTAPAVLYSALPFYRGAWRSLRARVPGMDVPVAIGILAAFGASVVATVQGDGAVYFDSVTMFIFLLLGSRYVELLARRSAAQELERLRHALPDGAMLLAAFPFARTSELVSAAALQAGDHISVAPGAVIAADGVIVEGASEIDLSLLTGESRAQARAAGMEVPGGAVNISQPVVLRVLRPAGESTLAQLVRLVESAADGKPRLALWADRVASWFVAALLVLTVLVFCAWQLIEPARAWPVAIALLVVSCPCALSLAMPSALAAATSSLVRRGVLIVQPHVLETLQRATHVVFDKTGTLTAGRPVLQAVTPLARLEAARCVAIAAALEAGSAHPLAQAIRAGALGAAVSATELRSVPGQGVEGMVDCCLYRLGRAAFACAGADVAIPDDGATYIYLGDGQQALARIALADGVRDDALAVVQDCQRRGKQVVILSGDGNAVVRRVAAQLGVREALGEQLPADKLAYVRVLQAQGAVVAVVGDGINDAAVLRAADVSFAMGSGAALAQLHADCVLMSGRLGSFSSCAATATRSARIVRQNLAWACLYNLLAIPAAAFGLLNPWVSAVGMSLSSALVVLNALRLRRSGNH